MKKVRGWKGHLDGQIARLVSVLHTAGLLLGTGLIHAQEPARGGEPLPSDTAVISGNPMVKVKLGGRVHRMVQLVADGRETDIFFTDSDQGPTMVRVDATARLGEKLVVGAAIEIGLQQNRPLFVSQDDPDVPFDVSSRVLEIYAAATQIGKFSLGRGFMASYVTWEVDLSGTLNASLLSVGSLFGGLKFVDRTTNELTDIHVRDHHFSDLERLLIKDRLRYDSPRFVGLQGSASIAAADRWDVALRTRHLAGDFRMVGASTYQRNPFLNLDWRWDGGLSTRHEPTGLNATVAVFSQRPHATEMREAHGFIVKLGWLAELMPIGKTAVSADIARNFNIGIDGDEGKSFGIFVLQNWDQFGIRVYVGVRQYDVDRPDISLKPLTVVPFGALLQF